MQRRKLPLSEQDTPGLLQALARVPDPRDSGPTGAQAHLLAALNQAGGGRVGEVGDEGGVVPVVFHRLRVVAQHGGAGTEPDAGLGECGPFLAGGPGGGWGDRGELVVPAGKFVRAAVIIAAGAEGYATSGDGVVESCLLVAAEHPPVVNRGTAGGHGRDRAVRVVAGQRVVVDHRDVDPGGTGRVGFGREVVGGPAWL